MGAEGIATVMSKSVAVAGVEYSDRWSAAVDYRELDFGPCDATDRNGEHLGRLTGIEGDSVDVLGICANRGRT